MRHTYRTMIIKNISGSTQYVAIGQRAGRGSRFARGRELANNATATFDDSPKSIADARALVNRGLISILSGPDAASEDGSVLVPASGSITLTAAGPANADFVILNGVKFQWAASASGLATGVVWAGAGAAGGTAAGTLRTAVNAHATVGVKLGSTLTVGTDPVLPVTASAGSDITVGANYPLSKSGAPITVPATLANGTKGKIKESVELTHTVTAGNVTATLWVVPTGVLSTPSNWLVQCRTSAGAIKPTDTCEFSFDTITKGNLIVDDGSSVLAAGDILTIHVLGA